MPPNQEFCAGGDLYARLVRAGGLMGEAEVCRDVAVPLLLTLTFLHASHIVHRCDAAAGGRGARRYGCLTLGSAAAAARLLRRRCIPQQRLHSAPHPFLSLPCSDIKPENVFFTGDGGLRLGDFGLSIDATRERPTSRVGTLDYM